LAFSKQGKAGVNSWGPKGKLTFCPGLTKEVAQWDVEFSDVIEKHALAKDYWQVYNCD
jgi:hypothetical protein